MAKDTYLDTQPEAGRMTCGEQIRRIRAGGSNESRNRLCLFNLLAEKWAQIGDVLAPQVLKDIIELLTKIHEQLVL